MREFFLENSGYTSNYRSFYSQDLRSQLSQERDSVRHISLQKEIEVKDLQTRLEKSVRIGSSTYSCATNRVLGGGTGQDARDARWC